MQKESILVVVGILVVSTILLFAADWLGVPTGKVTEFQGPGAAASPSPPPSSRPYPGNPLPQITDTPCNPPSNSPHENTKCEGDWVMRCILNQNQQVSTGPRGIWAAVEYCPGPPPNSNPFRHCHDIWKIGAECRECRPACRGNTMMACNRDGVPVDCIDCGPTRYCDTDKKGCMCKKDASWEFWEPDCEPSIILPACKDVSIQR